MAFRPLGFRWRRRGSGQGRVSELMWASTILGWRCRWFAEEGSRESLCSDRPAEVSLVLVGGPRSHGGWPFRSLLEHSRGGRSLRCWVVLRLQEMAWLLTMWSSPSIRITRPEVKWIWLEKAASEVGAAPQRRSWPGDASFA